ncbi:MAG: hypothetical protein HUK40_09530 [Desulfobacter sp.]|nr:hypothetical protein [Desulfobacter sp.]
MTKESIKSLGSGIGGVIVLALFAVTFLTIEKVVFILPLFLSFTGAMIGFQLAESLKERIRGRFLFPFIMGSGQGAAVFVIVNFTGNITHRWPGLTLTDLGLYILVSGMTSYLGARLATRNFNL